MKYLPLNFLVNDQAACRSIFEECFEDTSYHFAIIEDGYTVIQGSAKTFGYNGPGISSSTTRIYIGSAGEIFATQMNNVLNEEVDLLKIALCIKTNGYTENP